MSFIDTVDSVVSFLKEHPARSSKNIAKHLDIPRKRLKAALFFAKSQGDLTFNLRSPLNNRRKRPVWSAASS